MTPEPFRIAIADAEIEDLRRRLRATRWAPDFGNEDWRYGVERGWLEAMVGYWAAGFDWRAQEAAMNALPHWRVEIDGVPIHYVHVRGKGPDPTPLVLTHGWPWTFWDYRKLVGPLTDPALHGGDPADSFDLVIPSLPGFGFSTPLTTTGIDVPAIARLWVRLMRDGLGYDRFGACGGDWGATVTAQLGHAHGDALIGIFQTLAVVPGVDLANLTPADFAVDEQWMAARGAEAKPLTISHNIVHSTDPQTLAYALADSPVGCAAWLWERRRAWSDCGGDVLSVFDRDELCTLASIYWLTGTVATAMRLYYEHFRTGFGLRLSHQNKPAIAVPAGYALFPKEIVFTPRAMVAANVDLRRWSILPKGGHFAPAEQPGLVADELREFFRPLR
jgi:pimeloyl-ACP methyl ester carboxylesterase